ncbi:pyridoxal 5'-phosphate synthase glutaminase subunit PdxT [Gordonia shandongensis]|uniref:pyridoxal 5'-phosphate synthase glutaminase subunit PdxT n=1 Tax=Gordonia shandongensis TaxID=376351 RepID=UPI00041EC334|nr:pyridoxal 5'-phosphate synthase glutaminase subunit PdxT [Gordonia shandongensis]
MSHRIGVLALQGDVREHLGALERCGARPVPVRRPAELDALDGLVIPGGESTAIGRLLRVFDMVDPLRGRLRDGLPAYGSCAGMILLATTILDTRADAVHLDAVDASVRRNAFGRQTQSFEADVPFAGITDTPGAQPMRAVFIRAPWFEEVGPDVEVLARVEDPLSDPPVSDGAGGGRIVAVRQGDVLATSFHPEVTGDVRVHRYFVDMVAAA